LTTISTVMAQVHQMETKFGLTYLVISVFSGLTCLCILAIPAWTSDLNWRS
jgi:fluoride ion exporter CrcB/FEX